MSVSVKFDADTSGNLTQNDTDGAITITITTSGSITSFLPTTYAGALVIPDTIEGYTVTSIGNFAFYDCTSLTSITIPNSVTSISAYAFYNCTSFATVTFAPGSQVTSIGNNAFYGCTSLTSITIPNSVTSIGVGAFQSCTGLTSITIPASVTSISDFAFQSCTLLATVTFLGNVPTLGSNAFTIISASATVYYLTNTNSVDLTTDFSKIFQYSVNGSNASITSFLPTTYAGALVIPDTIEGYTVTSIGNNAFQYCTSLATVTFAPGSLLITIGSNAFNNCSGLTSITIPNSVTSIGNYAFNGCTSLTSITIPNSVTSIGSAAFYLCTSLASITIPNSVTSIDSAAFYLCTSLASITIPNSVTSIDSSAFRNCTSLTSIVIPNLVTYIASGAFQSCSSLTSITIPNSVTSIGVSAFLGCTSLTSITIPNSVTTIGVSAFQGCNSLATVTFAPGSQLLTIGGGAFQNCYALTSITIPNSVTSISADAFQSCTSLATISFLGNVPTLGSNAFTSISASATVYYLTNTNSVNFPTDFKKIFQYSVDGSNAIITSFLPTTYAGALVIPDNIEGYTVTSIGNYAFYDCSSLTSITIPNSVTSIGNNAFQGCNNLASVTFLNNVPTLGGSAFTAPNATTYYLTNTNNVNLATYFSNIFPDTGSAKFDADLSGILTPNDTGAITINMTRSSGSIVNFSPRQYAGAIVIPSTINSLPVINIGNGAFAYAHGLTSITIPNTVTSINYFAFANSNLTSIEIPASVQTIGVEAFWRCYALQSITFENNSQLTTIGNSAFYECTGLTTGVSIPASVITIGIHAFSGCTRLPSVTFASDSQLTTISAAAFYNCTSLTSITIPNSVTSVGDSAFLGCTLLATVTFLGNVPTIIGVNAFSAQNDTVYYLSNTNNVTLATYFSKIIQYSVNGSNATITSFLPKTYAGALVIPDTIGGYAVTAIDIITFANCINLTLVTIPASVTFIGDGTFLGCNSLINISVDINNTEFLSVDGVLYNKNKTTLIQYPIGNTRIAYTVDDSTQTISSAAFYNCTSLTSIEIPASVTSIALQAFHGCQNLATVIFLGNAPALGDSAFTGISANATVYYISNTNSVDLTTYFNKIFQYSVNGSINSFLPKTYAGALVIPSAIGSYTVTTIGNNAFASCVNLTSIEIPASVTAIGNNTFQGCIGLLTVTFATGSLLTSIGVSAFQDTTSLTSIIIPASVTTIGEDAFRNTGLTSIIIPASVTSIGSNAFMECTSLTSISVDSSNPNYSSDDGILYNKDKTTLIRYPIGKQGSTATIPNSVTSIATSAFQGCTALATVTFLGNVPTLGSSAFTGISASATVYYLTNTNSVNFPTDFKKIFQYSVDGSNATITSFLPTTYAGALVIPSAIGGYTVTAIGSNAFYVCTKLSSIVIPNSVTSIGNETFRGCTLLETVTFAADSQVTSIGTSAFYACTSLTSITIPNSVTSIGNNAFQGCNSLATVTFDADSQLTSIGTSAFYACTSLTSITIPNSVTTIGIYAFQGCTLLETVTFAPGSLLTSIGAYAFYNCTSLTSITIPDLVTAIGASAFQNCSSLATISFLDNVQALGGSAFKDISASATAYYLTNTDNVDLATYFSKIIQYSVAESNATITSFSPTNFSGAVVIPGTIGGYAVTTIGSNAFLNRSSLTSIEIPASVTTIGASAFNGCAGLTSITIPVSVISIGANALSNCTSLTSITVDPNNIEFVSVDGVLYNKPGTTLIQYPIGKSDTRAAILNTVQTIAGYALWNCINIDSISVPASVQTISEYAFQGCINLSNVSFASDSQLQTIGASAFKDCEGLKSIEIPVSVTTIDNTAFIGSGLIRMYVYKNNQLAPSISPPQSVTYFGKTYRIELVPSEVTTSIKTNADFTNLVTDLFPSISPSTDVITTTQTVVNDPYVISSSIITIPNVSLSDLHPDQRRQLVETITNIYAEELNVSPDRLIVKLKSGSVIVTVEVLDDNVTASMVPICFPAGTKVTTDQGNIAIEKLKPNVHTIRGKKIVAITKSISLQKHIVSIEKDALVKNVPSVTTHISKEHQIFYKGEMVRAIDLVGVCQGVTTIPYNGEILYNVLLKKHDKMMVNNLICETLHPENIVARIHSKNFTPSQIDQLCVKLNRIIRTGNAPAYEKLHVALK